jgi:CheY-like chemotaxis protein
VAPSVDEVMARALAKDPAERYTSCREFAFDLAMELGVDTADLLTQESTAHVVVASENAATRAVVRGSLANMGVAVSEVRSGEIPAWLRDRRFDAVIASSDFAPEELSRLRRMMQPADGSPGPKLLILVPREPAERRAADATGADAELAQPFSGMQLALKLRRLLGPQAVRV